MVPSEAMCEACGDVLPYDDLEPCSLCGELFCRACLENTPEEGPVCFLCLREWQNGPKEGDMAGRGKLNAALREIDELQREKAGLEAENARLRADVQSLANRLADCSECLGRAAERKGCRCHEGRHGRPNQ